MNGLDKHANPHGCVGWLSGIGATGVAIALELHRAEQGLDVQALAGHKDAATTAIYKDTRGSEWVRVVA